MLAKLPGGSHIFSKYLSFVIPYSGSISARVLELRPGYSRVQLDDRRAIRNHLGSIHAVALMNLGELASGLALTTSIPDDARAILVNYSIEFKKKARGTLLAHSLCDLISSSDPKEITISAQIQDCHEDRVALVSAIWKIGPKR